MRNWIIMQLKKKSRAITATVNGLEKKTPRAEAG